MDEKFKSDLDAMRQFIERRFHSTSVFVFEHLISIRIFEHKAFFETRKD